MINHANEKRPWGAFEILEATPGFEPGVKALQASALPLGHVAMLVKKAGHFEIDRPFSILERTPGFEPATPTLARWCSTS